MMLNTLRSISFNMANSVIDVMKGGYGSPLGRHTSIVRDRDRVSTLGRWVDEFTKLPSSRDLKVHPMS